MLGQGYGSFWEVNVSFSLTQHDHLSKCVFLIDTKRPSELETNLVVDCLFFYFVVILKKDSNAA